MCPRLIPTLLLSLITLQGADPYCGAYTPALKLEWLASQARERAFRSYEAQSHVALKGTNTLDANNFIDTFIGSKMAADGVVPAALSTDAEFLRRVMLDLTGRIPTPEALDSFLANDRPDKRNELIESLLGSEAYVDRWSLFYRDLFQVTSRYYQFVPPEGRNKFGDYLRDFVAKDRPYNMVAREIIAAEGVNIDYVKLQSESHSAFHVHTLQWLLAKSSNVKSHTINWGGRLVRDVACRAGTGERQIARSSVVRLYERGTTRAVSTTTAPAMHTHHAIGFSSASVLANDSD